MEGSSLYQKLCAVKASIVERLPKTGVNAHFGYRYVEADRVVAAVRDPLFKAGVDFGVEVVRAERTGERGERAEVEVLFTFRDVDTGESVTYRWVGEAYDPQDKGFNKAITAAKKYFLIANFLIPTAEEDADAVAGGPIEESSAASARPSEPAARPAPRGAGVVEPTGMTPVKAEMRLTQPFALKANARGIQRMVGRMAPLGADRDVVVWLASRDAELEKLASSLVVGQVVEVEGMGDLASRVQISAMRLRQERTEGPVRPQQVATLIVRVEEPFQETRYRGQTTVRGWVSDGERTFEAIADWRNAGVIRALATCRKGESLCVTGRFDATGHKFRVESAAPGEKEASAASAEPVDLYADPYGALAPHLDGPDGRPVDEVLTCVSKASEGVEKLADGVAARLVVVSAADANGQRVLLFLPATREARAAAAGLMPDRRIRVRGRLLRDGEERAIAVAEWGEAADPVAEAVRSVLGSGSV